MGFSTKQIRALQRSIDKRDLRFRTLNGRELTYIEGWHAIAEANRIFGFDKWDRETVETRCILGRELRGNYVAVYMAKVRISVRASGETVIREGQGTGEAKGSSPGEVHDMALKTAETDATKRALATFGRPFGLSLYVTPRITEKGKSADGGAARAAFPSAPASAATTQAPRVESASINPSWPEPDRQISPESTPEESVVTTIAQNGAQCPVEHHRPVPAKGEITVGSGRGPDTADPRPPSRLTPAHEALPSANDNKAGEATADRTKIDKSILALAEPKRRRDKAHLAFVASQPCLVCGRAPSDPHHLRFMQPRAMGLKVSDEFTVPLCRIHHRQLHRAGNEASWWSDLEIDAERIAHNLWRESRELATTNRHNP